MLLLLGTAYAYLRVEWEGADLGDNLASMLNKRMRGRITVGSIEWQPSALKSLVTGGWVPVVIRDVKVWDDCALSSELDPSDERRRGDPNEDCTRDHRPDPDPTSKRKPRKLLIDAPHIEAEIDLHAALFGHHDLIFRHVVVYGGKLLLEQTREPYPLHAYDRNAVSVLTVFYPRMKAGFRAGIYADSTPPQFDLRDVRIENLDVTVQFGPYENKDGTIGYAVAGHIEDVNIDLTPTGDPETYLHNDATDPLVTKFYVRLALHGKHTRLRFMDEGKRETFVMPGTRLNEQWAQGRRARTEFELSEIAINRLAQLPDQWGKKDYVANNLEMDISAHTIPCKVNGVAGNPADGADVRLTGQLLEWWDRPYDGKWDLALDVKNFGPTLRTCIKPTLGGDNLHGTIKLSGPFIASPKVSLDLHNLDFDVPLSATEEPVRLTLADVDGDIDLVNEQGSIQRTKALIRGGKEPGEVMVSATFGLKPLYSVADIDITNPIDIGRFLPPKVSTSVGKFLSGKLRVRGDVDAGFALENFDLRLARTATEGAQIRVYGGRIFTKDSFHWINIENVQFQAGKSHASINGPIEYNNGTFYYRNVEIEGDYPDLSMWLERFGLPPLIQSAGGGGKIVLNGPVDNPTINVRIMLAGLPCIDTLKIDNATISNGILDARVSTTGLGGNLSGSVRADISGPTKVIQKLELTGAKVEAAKLCGLKGMVKGTIENVKIGITEPTVIDKNKPATDWLSSMTMTATAPRLNVLGESYSRVAIRINQNVLKQIPSWLTTRLDPDDVAQCDEASKKGGFCALVEASRDLGGKLGTLVADVPPTKSGRVTLARKLGGTIALDDIPLAVLEPFIGKGVVGGLISATLHLGGTPKAPSVEIGSTINLTRAWIGGAYVGDTQLGVIPTTYGNVDAIRVYGNLMAGQLGLDAIIGTAAPYPVDLALSGRRIEVGPFYDITKKLGLSEELQAWATGTVTLRTELSPTSGKPAQPEAWVELTEVQASLNHKTRDGRRMPLRFDMVPRNKNDFALSMRVTPSTLELACRNYNVQGGRSPCPARLVTPAGIVEISGGATQSQMAISALGQSLELRRLAPLFENQIDDISGTLELNAKVGGTFDKPTYEASLEVKDMVSVRLPGGDSVLQVLGPRVVEGETLPGAQIKIANGTVGLGSFTINVKDPRKDEQGELHVSGSIALAGFKPASWGLLIDGKIAGKMLSAIAPSSVAQGSGLARIDAALSGKGLLPRIDATVTFDPEEGTRAQPLALFPRGVRREIAMLAGSVQITTREVGTHRTYTLDFRDNPIRASIDNEGGIL